MGTTDTTTNGAPTAKGGRKKAETTGAPKLSRAAPPPPAPPDPGTETDLPTAADIELAAACLPSNRKAAIRSVSTKLVDTYATPALQTAMTGLIPLLATFKGCGEIQATLDLATQGKVLARSFARLQAATDRVGQRVIEISQQLQTLDIALTRAQATAAPGTPVAKGLTSLAKLRGSKLARTKGKRTKNRNKKKKTAKA